MAFRAPKVRFRDFREKGPWEEAKETFTPKLKTATKVHSNPGFFQSGFKRAGRVSHPHLSIFVYFAVHQLLRVQYIYTVSYIPSVSFQHKQDIPPYSKICILDSF